MISTKDAMVIIMEQNNRIKFSREDNPKFLLDYISYLRSVKMCAERTVQGYFQDIRVFLRYLLCDDVEKSTINDISIKDFDVRRLDDVTVMDIREFLSYLMEYHGNSKSARARKIVSLRGLYTFLNRENYIANNPLKDIDKMPINKVEPVFLSLSESKRLLDAADGTRDYCIITLFLNCGMRLSELVGLNKNDINYDDCSVHLLGKGNKRRTIYLNNACLEALDAYLTERGENPPDEPYALFLSQRNKRISKRRVQQIIEDTLQKAGLDGKGLSTHKLRHTAATLMYQYGDADALILKEILGHVSVATTQIYTHVGETQKRNAIDNSPLANIKKGNTNDSDNNK